MFEGPLRRRPWYHSAACIFLSPIFLSSRSPLRIFDCILRVRMRLRTNPHIILSGRGKESIAEGLARQGLMTWLSAHQAQQIREAVRNVPAALETPRSSLRAPCSPLPLLAPRSTRTSLTHFTTAGTIAAGAQYVIT